MEGIETYILDHIGREHPYLAALERDTNIYLVRSHMSSGHLQGKFLRMMVALFQPRRILEIGTYSGYSALSMASALPEDGQLITYEINDELEDFTRPRIEGSPWGDKVQFRIGDILQERLENLPRFDMVFMDGNKRQYMAYYELALKVTRRGGLVLADNTLWDGHVVDALYDKDAQTCGIRAFNDFVARDERVEKVMLPLRDGLTMMRIV